MLGRGHQQSLWRQKKKELEGHEKPPFQELWIGSYWFLQTKCLEHFDSIIEQIPVSEGIHILLL